MKKFWSILFFTLILVSCNRANKHQDTTDYIPENTSIIIQVNNLEGLKSNLKNSDFLQTLSASKTHKQLCKKLKNLDYLDTTNPLLLCFNYDKNDSLQYTIITKQTPNLFLVDSLPNISNETYLYNSLSIHKIQIESSITYHTSKDSIFIASSSKDVLEAAIINTNKDLQIKNILKVADAEKVFSILINNHQKQAIKSVFKKDSIPFKSFTNYTLLDADINQDALILNGITKATDSTKNLINIFKNVVPQENTIANIAPNNADGFISFTFDDFTVFIENLKKFNHTDSAITNTTLFDNVTEVGVIYEGSNHAVILNALDVIATKDALLNEQDMLDTFRQVVIYNFSENNLFRETFSPLITFNQANFYANIDSYFVFANNKETLENIIANYQNKTTFSSRSYYQDIQENLTNNASLLAVTNSSDLKNILNKNLHEDLDINLKDYKASALQFTYDTNFAHVNAIIKKSKAKLRENSVTEMYTTQLEADLLNNPQLVTNHITKQKEIVVQDINNNLYLISNTGKVLWKKQLPGAILGEISQIDMYKNGRLQLVFATPKRVFVLDRNGKDAAPFPLKFNDEITQPLSVFDYDKNKKYRLLVTQGKNVLMYDAKGKTVKGFKFKAAKSTINHQPQHFRIGSKDYLTIKTDNKLHIIDRVGRTRVTPKNNYNYSNQALYLYKGKFTTTTKDGRLVSFNTNGSSATQNLNLNEKHHLTTTTKTLVAQTENMLTIKSKTLALDFGNYDIPKLFYIKDKIYVSVTDLQTQKVYLYDSNGKLQNNFPVYGNAAIALDNFDKDRNLEFVTKGENNTLIIYQIN